MAKDVVTCYIVLRYLFQHTKALTFSGGNLLHFLVTMLTAVEETFSEGTVKTLFLKWQVNIEVIISNRNCLVKDYANIEVIAQNSSNSVEENEQIIQLAFPCFLSNNVRSPVFL